MSERRARSSGRQRSSSFNYLDNSFDAPAELRDIVCTKNAHWQAGQDATKKLQDLYPQILSKLMRTRPSIRSQMQRHPPIVTRMQPLSISGLASIYGRDGIIIDDVDRVFICIRPLLQHYSMDNQSAFSVSPREILSPLMHPRHLDRSAMNITRSSRTSLCGPSNKIRNPRMVRHLDASRVIAHWVSLVERSHMQLLREILLLDPRTFLEMTAWTGMTPDIVSFTKRLWHLVSRLVGTTSSFGLPSSVNAIIFTNLFGALALMNIPTGASVAYSYVVNLSGVSTFLQGRTPEQLPFQSFFYPYNAYFGLGANVFLSFIQGWTTFQPFDVGAFVDVYILLPLFPIIMFVFKFVNKTKWQKLDVGRRKDLDNIKEELVYVKDDGTGVRPPLWKRLLKNF
ncbi:hypothetical protein FA15DRAFT_705576 [Coprinopsis marcescibilis]|uniref:Amino acid permease/ SLC12A domain-containing protein n=1 Tax=Coprinopsis marcescibilis TaxID=230819 RepID=A0A5C3L531_COPMA|nr:hypothetical protein FA15DRAFT_705576 [Coprinopsis marcescibilis]